MLLHHYYIQNAQVYETNTFKPNTGIEVYEVIRIVDGIPLFLEDHLKRFFHSAWLCHLEIPLDEKQILSVLRELITVNGIAEGNIRFSYCFRPAGNFQAYFIPHRYPDEREQSEGVECGMLFAERSDPNAKVVQSGIRETADQMINENRYYEALLVNRHNQLTEGSRSNLFFVKGKTFFTAPEEEVLPGITRKKVIDLIHEIHCNLEEKSLDLDEAGRADAAFLTGTSPKILPIKKIGNLIFHSKNRLVIELMSAYDTLIQTYICDKTDRTPL